MKFLVNDTHLALEFPPRARNFLFTDKPICLNFPTHYFIVPKNTYRGKLIINNSLHLFLKKDGGYYVPPLPGSRYDGSICLDNRYKPIVGSPEKAMKKAINQFWENKLLMLSEDWLLTVPEFSEWFETNEFQGTDTTIWWHSDSLNKYCGICFEKFQEVKNFNNLL